MQYFITIFITHRLTCITGDTKLKQFMSDGLHVGENFVKINLWSKLACVVPGPTTVFASNGGI